jgi:mRNA interferase HicA
MKRRDFEKHLAQHGCMLRREGAGHSVYVNATATRSSSVPRHNELKAGTVRAICKQLGIPQPPVQ